MLGDTAGLVAGSVLGSLVAKQASAAERGATLQLLVAVTAETIHVLNRDESGTLASEFASFARASTTVDIHHVGLSRHLTLTDAAGAALVLHGSVSWLSAQAAGDKVVLGLLASD